MNVGIERMLFVCEFEVRELSAEEGERREMEGTG